MVGREQQQCTEQATWNSETKKQEDVPRNNQSAWIKWKLDSTNYNEREQQPGRPRAVGAPRVQAASKGVQRESNRPTQPSSGFDPNHSARA